MSRYIDAYALREKVLYHADTMNHAGNHEQAKAFNYCLCMIDDMPTADVVEVVRCKDCKRYTKNCFCEYWQSVGAVAQLASFDYCSYGERREEHGN